MEAFVSLTQLFECCFEEGLVLVSLSSTQRCQPIQPHIDAYCRLPFLWAGIWNFNRKAHKPPIRRFRDPCACHLAFETQILRHVDPSELGYPKAMIAQLELIVREIEAGFASLFAFEARAVSPALKERRKRLAQVQNRLIRSILGHLRGPGELFPPDLVELLLEF